MYNDTNEWLLWVFLLFTSIQYSMQRNDPNYSKQYYHARKTADPDYYRLYSQRKHYRKQLKITPESNVERRTKITNRIDEINAQLAIIKQSRGKYNHWQNRSDDDHDNSKNIDSL